MSPIAPLPIRATPRLAAYATTAAIIAALCSPLLALAWFATSGGAATAQEAHVAAWAEPARSLAGPLLTFAGTDMVYALYSSVLLLSFPAVILVALATQGQRIAAASRPERWGWRIALVGYLLFGSGGLAMAFLLLTSVADPVVDVVFLSMMIPGLLLSLSGSTVLGITFVRSRHHPRLTSWLLALAFPLWVAGSFGFGHNSLGLVPLFIAWAATARSWQTAEIVHPAAAAVNAS